MGFISLSCQKDDPVVTSISIPNELTIDIGSSKKVNVTHVPSNLPSPNYSWQSSNSAIFTIDSQGNINAVGVGEATLTVTATELNLSATSKIIVLPINASSVSIKPNPVEILLGETLQLEGTVLPENTTDKTIAWKSEDEKIVTINEKGEIKAVGIGKTKVIATSGNVSGTCEVAVNPIKVEKVTLNVNKLTLKIGDTNDLTATIEPANATDKTVTWTSNNDQVATVSDKGLVTAVKEGKATITATAGSASASCEVTVEPINVTGISISNQNLELEVEQTATLTATVSPSNATNKKIVWTSSNNQIATVDVNGVVKGVTVGTTKIEAKTEDGGFTASCSVTVSPIKVKQINLNSINLSLLPSKSYKLIASIVPENAYNKKLIWTSSNPSIATVNQDGLVQALTTGNTTISVKSEDNGATSYCNVSINEITSFISLYFPSASVMSINGYISGSIYSGIINRSNETIELTSFGVYDGNTGVRIGYTTDPTKLGTLATGETTNLGMQLNSVYLPIYRWTFKWNSQEYTVQHQYTSSTRSTTTNGVKLNTID